MGWGCRAGATGRIVLRADSGYWSAKVIKACVDHDVRYSITVKQTGPVKRAIAMIDTDCWVLIRHPDPEHPVLHPNGSDHVDDNKDAVGQQAWVTETVLDGRRLIVRRTLDAPTQATLFDTWRYHAFVTDRTGIATELDLDHRRHAVVELAIRDLKNGSGMNHNPSGRFAANSAWLVLNTMAHNLLRWTNRLGFDMRGPIVTKTFRRRYLNLPGRLTRSARRQTLHLPTRWPWATPWADALARLRTINIIS